MAHFHHHGMNLQQFTWQVNVPSPGSTHVMCSQSKARGVLGLQNDGEGCRPSFSATPFRAKFATLVGLSLKNGTLKGTFSTSSYTRARTRDILTRPNFVFGGHSLWDD